MNPETQNIDLTSIAVALGRIEEKVSHLTGLEDRLRNVETAITELKAQQKPRAPWWVIMGGIAATGTSLAGFWVLFNLAADVAASVQ